MLKKEQEKILKKEEVLVLKGALKGGGGTNYEFSTLILCGEHL